jgi:predicted amidohydrolase
LGDGRWETGGAAQRERPPLRIAGCQFDVSGDIGRNRDQILMLVDRAADAGARIAHFPETALSGYAGVDLPSLDELDWPTLHAATEAICEAAARRRIWVLLGSTHRLSAGARPHNSVYVIADDGRIIDRYDKRFCTGILEPEPQRDLHHYSPGNYACLFEIDGYRAGILICYDYRFPELYRDLKQRGAEIVFQSFHNARFSREVYEQKNLWREVVPGTMIGHAACNHLWISATNSATRYSLWPTFFVQPDGQITGRLSDHETGVLVSEVNPSLSLWDAPGPWRERAWSGQLHSGRFVDDPRSHERTKY